MVNYTFQLFLLIFIDIITSYHINIKKQVFFKFHLKKDEFPQDIDNYLNPQESKLRDDKDDNLQIKDGKTQISPIDDRILSRICINPTSYILKFIDKSWSLHDIKQITFDATTTESVQELKLLIKIIKMYKIYDLISWYSRDQRELAPFIVILTASNYFNFLKISENLALFMKHNLNIEPIRIDGQIQSGWQVHQYTTTIIHIFSDPIRKRFELEEFYMDIPPLIIKEILI